MSTSELDQHETPFFSAWRAYRDAGIVPYSTPGHKRGRGAPAALVETFGLAALGLDIPHGGGVDDTHLSRGHLRAAERLAAAAWGADNAVFLVNGSSTGNHAFLLATCRSGDEVVIARNLHTSLLAGLILSGARPVYVRPAVDPLHDLSLDVAVDDVRRALDDHPAAKAVILVSPAYTGVSSDLPAIARLCRERGVPLLVDEAWGPHFPFHPDLPPSAMQAGASAAVTSIHKLLSGITQAALLTLGGPLVDPGRFRSAVSMLQTTSPAAFIYASIDLARRQMALHGRDLLDRTLALSARVREQLSDIPGVAVIGPEVIRGRRGAGFDPTRLLVDVHGLGLTGYEAERILRERFRVGVEMSDLVSVIVMLTVGDDDETAAHLVAGFRGLAEEAREQRRQPGAVGFRSSGSVILAARQAMTPREAAIGDAEAVAPRSLPPTRRASRSSPPARSSRPRSSSTSRRDWPPGCTSAAPPTQPSARYASSPSSERRRACPWVAPDRAGPPR